MSNIHTIIADQILDFFYYPKLLITSLLSHSFISPSSKISFAKTVQIGRNTIISPGSVLTAGKNGRIKIGNGCTIEKFAILKANVGFISMGDNCSVNSFCFLGGYGGIRIGNGVRIAPGAKIFSYEHFYDKIDMPIHQQGIDPKEVIIEDDVWIGSNVIITGGVIIKKGSIVAAGAVVTKSFEEYSILAGVPAQLIKKRS